MNTCYSRVNEHQRYLQLGTKGGQCACIVLSPYVREGVVRKSSSRIMAGAIAHLVPSIENVTQANSSKQNP